MSEFAVLQGNGQSEKRDGRGTGKRRPATSGITE